ncbi:MAG: RNA polymerase sigma factor RpoD/SigA [Spirochaetaceae bacterium]|jgi:RNA polymerase primary sigma factor|nr:RNA polymerase sigma factor RpoD/SigA [Spirochaetaceae bacterium]
MTSKTLNNKTTVSSMGTDENILSMYLKEINRLPLLTREEEDAVAREAAKGSQTARDRLVNSNLRFVVNVAKKYQGQGMPLSDLISEGNIGLLNAIERYDVDKGYHFISYAVWWIRQAILKAICEKSRMIRLPLNRANELVQIEKARKIVQSDNNSEAEVAEIARLLDMDASQVSDLINISRDLVSLENPIYTDKDSSNLGDFIEDENYASPDEDAVKVTLQNDIESVLSTLNKKEADIIRYRFGLGNSVPMSLKEIGDRFNLTKERIRQIEKKALKRLQHPSRQRFLESYVA